MSRRARAIPQARIIRRRALFPVSGNVRSCCCAFAAAGFALWAGAFWLMSAWGELKMYWGQAPADDPFFQVLPHSARMNRLAAWSACISAVLAGVAEITAAWSARSTTREINSLAK